MLINAISYNKLFYRKMLNFLGDDEILGTMIQNERLDPSFLFLFYPWRVVYDGDIDIFWEKILFPSLFSQIRHVSQINIIYFARSIFLYEFYRNTHYCNLLNPLILIISYSFRTCNLAVLWTLPILSDIFLPLDA